MGRNKPARHSEEQTVESVRNAEDGPESEVGLRFNLGTRCVGVAMGTQNPMGGVGSKGRPAVTRPYFEVNDDSGEDETEPLGSADGMRLCCEHVGNSEVTQK